jgi:hypothetical protein
MTAKFQFILSIIMSLLTSCEDQNRQLPILGNKEVANNGKDTIDPGHDSIPVLNCYAKDIGVDNTQWHFVTGDREKIFDLAEKHYMVSAQVDA